jgi:N-methylhydantoinase B
MKVGMLSSEPVQPAAALDTVTLEIIRGKLIAVADEMGLVLARSSMSPVIYEVLDFACGICDADGLLIAQTNGITVFTGIFQTQIQAVLRKFAGRIHEGDVFLLNNPFEGGTHLCDVCIIRPIFVDGALAAFAIAVAHWSEVGGKTAGSLPSDATDIFQEGIRFPALKLFDRGVRQETIIEIITANGRLPKMSLGDLNAQLASVKIAEIRLAEVARKYSVAKLHKTFAHILAASERECRAAIVAMPKGTYAATDWVDGDGIVDARFPVKVVVTIADDSIIVDFTGSSPQVQGPVNCAEGAMVSAVKTVFKAEGARAGDAGPCQRRQQQQSVRDSLGRPERRRRPLRPGRARDGRVGRYRRSRRSKRRLRHHQWRHIQLLDRIVGSEISASAAPLRAQYRRRCRCWRQARRLRRHSRI